MLKQLIAISICLMINVSCFALAQNRKLVVLFTSDLHSQVLPDRLGYGGYSAIESLVQQNRAEAARDGAAFLLLDAGDIAMGTVFHSVYAQEGIEYRAMALLGNDSIEKDNSIPAGYIWAAVVVCCLLLFVLRKKIRLHI